MNNRNLCLDLATGKNRIRVALAGNPNSGKTSIFNALTGSTQYVGNWPGVTVEKKSGRACYKGQDFEIIDLPGTYSLSAFTDDEVVARNYLVKEKPDVVVNVVDATALEHSLFLTLQILELGLPTVIALNMSDEAEKQNIYIDAEKLSKMLGIPVIKTVGLTGKGIIELLSNAKDVAEKKIKSKYQVDYGKDIELSTKKIENALNKSEVLRTGYPVHFFAHKVLENDAQVAAELESIEHSEEIHTAVQKELAWLKSIYGNDIDILVADKLYSCANGITRSVVSRGKQSRIHFTEVLDSILLSRFFGVLMFLAVLWGVFQMTFVIGNPIAELIGLGLSKLGELVSLGLGGIPWLNSLIVDGIINGVGGVLTFFPNIFILFVFLSILEDSGYMARVAFLMDNIMSRIGLSGKAFVPYVISFGCSVPAVMATRTLESKRERIITILTAPLVSCSSRMEVMVFLAGLYFGVHAGSVAWGITAFGILLAIGMAKFFSVTLFKQDKPTPLIIELPPYRAPTIRSVLIHTWDRSKHFIKKAGGVILVGSLAFWALSSLPWGTTIEGSFIGKIGHSLEFLVAPLGLDWKAVIALLFGFIAKEVVISVFNQISCTCNVGQICDWFTPSAAIGFMLFLNLYTPCLATIAATKAEAGWKWALFQIAYSLMLAWLVAFAAYRIGGLFL